MQRWMSRFRILACGGVTLGVLQAIQNIDFNQIWFLFWFTIVNAFVSVLLGGDSSSLAAGGAGLPFGGFFL